MLCSYYLTYTRLYRLSGYVRHKFLMNAIGLYVRQDPRFGLQLQQQQQQLVAIRHRKAQLLEQSAQRKQLRAKQLVERLAAAKLAAEQEVSKLEHASTVMGAKHVAARFAQDEAAAVAALDALEDENLQNELQQLDSNSELFSFTNAPHMYTSPVRTTSMYTTRAAGQLLPQFNTPPSPVPYSENLYSVVRPTMSVASTPPSPALNTSTPTAPDSYNP